MKPAKEYLNSRTASSLKNDDVENAFKNAHCDQNDDDDDEEALDMDEFVESGLLDVADDVSIFCLNRVSP